MSNIITIANDNNGKRKKGGGIGAVLNLLKELNDFQEKVQICAEAQDLGEYRSKIIAFHDQLDQVGLDLIDLTKQSIIGRHKVDGNPEAELGDDFGDGLGDGLGDDLGDDLGVEDEIIEEPVHEETINSEPTHASQVSTVSAPTQPRMPR